jgi:hypothetical protein
VVKHTLLMVPSLGLKTRGRCPLVRGVHARAYDQGPQTNTIPSQPKLPPPGGEAARAELGNAVGKWLASPFDIVTFGARLAVGAVVSAPDRLGSLQDDIARVNEIVSSPAPPEDKLRSLASEAETCAPHVLEWGPVLIYPTGLTSSVSPQVCMLLACRP